MDESNVEIIFLIGYMRILSSWFVNKYKNKIVNIHPSLLPAFAGGIDKDVHAEVLKSKVKETRWLDGLKTLTPGLLKRRYSETRQRTKNMTTNFLSTRSRDCVD